MPARRTDRAVPRHTVRIRRRAVPWWMKRAACAGHADPDLWFAERGEDKRQREAVRICVVCPVRAACLAYALSMRPQAGIWGGTTEDQRRSRRKTRPAS